MPAVGGGGRERGAEPSACHELSGLVAAAIPRRCSDQLSVRRRMSGLAQSGDYGRQQTMRCAYGYRYQCKLSVISGYRCIERMKEARIAWNRVVIAVLTYAARRRKVAG